MMKKIICLSLCIAILLSCSYSYADGDGPDHERELELVLLGNELSLDSRDPKKHGNTPAVLFGYLEDAIYLCIDQNGNKGQIWLDELNNDFQVEGLPKSIDEINLPGGKHHQRFTHLGWDYKDYPMKEKWAIRQNILLATVSKVFDFPVDVNKTGNDKYTDECVQIAQLIYYVHILGDHSRNTLATTTDRIQLRNSKKTQGEIVAGLINNLRECISKLFWDQRTSMKYNWLRVKLDVIRFRAWKTGEEDSEEKHVKVQDIAESTLKYLRPNIRRMLMEKDYFMRVFGDIVVKD